MAKDGQVRGENTLEGAPIRAGVLSICLAGGSIARPHLLQDTVVAYVSGQLLQQCPRLF